MLECEAMTGSSLQGPPVDREPRRAGTLPLTALFTLTITGFVMLVTVAGREFPELDRGPAYAMSETADLNRTCLGDRVEALAAPGIEVFSAPEFFIDENPIPSYHCTLGWTVAGEILSSTLLVEVSVWDDAVPEYTGAIAAAEDAENRGVTSTAVPGFANSFCTQGGTAKEPDTTYVCRLSDANLEVAVYHSIFGVGDVAVFGPESVDMIELAAATGEAAKAAFRL